jgi:dimethylargininase
MDACELTHLTREPIDTDLLRFQHTAYAQALASAGCEVQELPAEPELPDAIFVEDVAVVLDEVAIITRPGAVARRPETDSVASALRPHRPLFRLTAPATLDGGDVLVLGRTLFVGRSSRTNAEGVAQLRSAVEPLGYTVRPVRVSGCLHLKSAACRVADGLILLQPDWVDASQWDGFATLKTHAAESGAANALVVNETLLYPTAFPRTRHVLELAGMNVVTLETSEVAKAEGALTCCSLLVNRLV